MKKSDAIKYFDGVSGLARALSISKSAIYQWPDDVPDSSAYKLQVITDGRLTVAEATERADNKACSA